MPVLVVAVYDNIRPRAAPRPLSHPAVRPHVIVVAGRAWEFFQASAASTQSGFNVNNRFPYVSPASGTEILSGGVICLHLAGGCEVTTREQPTFVGLCSATPCTFLDTSTTGR